MVDSKQLLEELLEELVEIYSTRSKGNDLSDQEILKIVDQGLARQGMREGNRYLSDGIKFNATRAQSYYFLHDINPYIRANDSKLYTSGGISFVGALGLGSFTGFLFDLPGLVISSLISVAAGVGYYFYTSNEFKTKKQSLVNLYSGSLTKLQNSAESSITWGTLPMHLAEIPYSPEIVDAEFTEKEDQNTRELPRTYSPGLVRRNSEIVKANGKELKKK